MSRLDTKAFGLKKTSRIKAFVFRFISVPAKWIMTCTLQLFYELLIPAIVADERVAIRVVKDIRVEIKLYEIYPVTLYAVVQKVEDIFARPGLRKVHEILPAVLNIAILMQSDRLGRICGALDLKPQSEFHPE